MDNFNEDCEYIIKNIVPSKTLPRNIQKIVREKLDNIIKTNKLKNIKDLSNLIEQYIFTNKDKIRFSTAFINSYDEYKLNELNKTNNSLKDTKLNKTNNSLKDTKLNKINNLDKDIQLNKSNKLVNNNKLNKTNNLDKDIQLNKSSKIVNNNKLKTQFNNVGKFIKTKIKSNDNYDKLSDFDNSDEDTVASRCP